MVLQLLSLLMIYDCIIVGAGPAGVISAIHLKRSGLRILLFEKNQVGGLVRNAHCIKNYLGFPKGISGKELAQSFRKHLKRLAINVVTEEVVAISQKTYFTVQTEKHSYKAKIVIVATGTKPKHLGIRGEEELIKKKVFYNIIDLPRLAGRKRILIVGGGDVGFDYAIHLHNEGHDVTMIMQGAAKCLPFLKKEATERNINFFERTVPKIILWEEDAIGVTCNNGTFTADYILVAVGREPNIPKLQKKKGLHFVGDVHHGSSRQVHVATGDALYTAMKISNDLLSSPHHQRSR